MCVSLRVALLLFKTLFVLLLGFLLVAALWSHYSLGSATSLTITAVSGSAPRGPDHHSYICLMWSSGQLKDDYRT